MTNYADSNKSKHIAIAALVAVVFWFLFSLDGQNISPSGKNIDYFWIFIYNNIKIPLTLLIMICGFIFKSIKNTEVSITSCILGCILGSILGYILGVVAGYVLAPFIGVVLGYVLGFILGDAITSKK